VPPRDKVPMEKEEKDKEVSNMNNYSKLQFTYGLFSYVCPSSTGIEQ
jgi:hypothetical protein